MSYHAPTRSQAQSFLSFFTTLALALVLSAPMPVSAQDHNHDHHHNHDHNHDHDQDHDQDQSFIRLQEIDGRTWLIDPSGQPFFAHGVTHMDGHAGEDVTAMGEACKNLGFNAYGYGCAHELKSDMPYLEGRNLLPISTYRVNNGSFTYIDIFDPSEQAGLEAQVRRMCMSNRDNPNLIGYCWTDLGAWPLENVSGTNWVEFTRNLPVEAPGHQAYLAFLETWEGGDDAEARDLAFLRLIAREYFRVVGEANRRYDPNHLIFGDRFVFQTYVPEVVEEMLPYVDAIAIQPNFNPGFPKENFDRIHKQTGKPILICDFAIRFQDGDKNIRGWRPEASAKIAGERYAEYIRAAVDTPYIIGAFWCNPIDSVPNFGTSGIKQGIFDKGLTPRPELNEQFRELNEYLVEITPKL